MTPVLSKPVRERKWENEIEKMFDNDVRCLDCEAQYFNEQETEHGNGCKVVILQSFIRKLLISQLDVVKNKVKKMEKDFSCSPEGDRMECAYDEAISDVLSVIKKLKDSNL